MRDDKGYRKLIAWQKSNLLAHLIYDVTVKFPKDELFSLTYQMRRATLSVCANIAEGYSRGSLKDRKHFYQMSIGSLTELEFFIDFAYERKFINLQDYETVLDVHIETARILRGLFRAS